MQSITFRADPAVIDAARARALAEGTTLNEQFRLWLARYAHSADGTQRYDDLMPALRGRVKVGRKLNRDEMNER